MKEVISSRQNPRIREVCALVEKKYRRESRCFRFDGIKLLREAIGSSVEILEIYVRVPIHKPLEEILAEAKRAGRITEEMVVPVSESVFEKLSEEKSPEGVLTVARQLDIHQTVEGRAVGGRVGRGERLLVAEALRDPGNLGTVMRSCAALGVDRLILSDDCADLYHPKTVRSAMGALFRLPTVTVPSEEFASMIAALRDEGRRVYATALRKDAKTVGALRLEAGDCFVIGNEGHGLREETIEACTETAIIPMREGNESLNAAAAAAICIWETVRAGK